MTAAMQVCAPPPILGALVERCYLGPRVRATVAASLQALKRHCETV